MENPNLPFNPTLLFCYNRLDVVKRTISFLSKNKGAKHTDLFIFSDGFKKQSDELIIQKLRSYLHTVKGFKSVSIKESSVNKGLARSIIDGVSEVLKIHNSVIVLEDDLLTSPNFLLYMNQCLAHYKDNKKVFSISGYTPPTISNFTDSTDVFFFPRNSSHGWATWKDRWEEVDWEVSDYQSFILDKKQIMDFNFGGSDLTSMLKSQMDGKINSWSIRFCYHQFKTKTLTVYPIISKIQNIGFGAGATHTNNYNRFFTKLDSGGKEIFKFPDQIYLEARFTKQFQQFYSLRERGLGRLKTYLFKAGLLKNK